MGQLNRHAVEGLYEVSDKGLFENGTGSDHITLDSVKLPPFAAKEYLLKRVTEVIKYYDMKDLSSLERTGRNDFHAKKRVRDLKEHKDDILSLIAMAEENSTNIKVESYLKISFEK